MGYPAESYERYSVPGLFAPWAARLVRSANVHPGERVLDVRECALGSLHSDLDGFPGAMEVEQPDLSAARRDHDVGRIAGEARARHAVLHDVERIHHDARDIRAALVADQLPLEQEFRAEDAPQPFGARTHLAQEAGVVRVGSMA